MSHHLSYDKHSSDGINSGNSRNGYSKNTLKSASGNLAVKIPRDRNGFFEPIAVGKGERITDELAEKILYFYSTGLSTRDIQAQIKDVYGADISASRLMNRLNQIVISTSYENELSIKHNFFHTSISSQSRPECLLNLKKYLIKIFSKLNEKHAIRALSNLMCDLDEQPYPLTKSIIKELKLFSLERIKTSGPQCAKQAISENNKDINLFQQFLLVCQ